MLAPVDGYWRDQQERSAAKKTLAKAHLKVQRQREDFARKAASTLITSHDLIAYEDLKIRHMVKNHHLAKSIHDAGWGTFLRWVNYYASVHGIPAIAVPPQYTTQACSACGAMVKRDSAWRSKALVKAQQHGVVGAQGWANLVEAFLAIQAGQWEEAEKQGRQRLCYCDDVKRRGYAGPRFVEPQRLRWLER